MNQPNTLTHTMEDAILLIDSAFRKREGVSWTTTVPLSVRTVTLDALQNRGLIFHSRKRTEAINYVTPEPSLFVVATLIRQKRAQARRTVDWATQLSIPR